MGVSSREVRGLAGSPRVCQTGNLDPLYHSCGPFPVPCCSQGAQPFLPEQEKAEADLEGGWAHCSTLFYSPALPCCAEERLHRVWGSVREQERPGERRKPPQKMQGSEEMPAGTHTHTEAMPFTQVPLSPRYGYRGVHRGRAHAWRYT